MSMNLPKALFIEVAPGNSGLIGDDDQGIILLYDAQSLCGTGKQTNFGWVPQVIDFFDDSAVPV